MHKLWFLLLIAFLPVQLGRHFWPDFAMVSGLRVDYLSPTLYLTDIIIFFLFLSWRPKIKIPPPWLVFLGLILIGIFLSKNPSTGFYGLVKLMEFLLLGFFIAQKIDLKKNWHKIILLLSLGMVIESFLAIGQFYHQSSIGGIFWFLGERTFNGVTPGIANAVIDGQLALRPYGTFPHPNVLAGYLITVMILIMYDLRSKIYHLRRLFLIGTLVLGTIALFLTMSRVAILVWLLVLCFWSVVFVLKQLKKRKIFALCSLLFALLITSLIFVNTSLWSRFNNLNLLDESLVRRGELAIASMLMLKDNPLFGVGLNNFLVNLPFYQKTESLILYLQPVHNIYLLVAAETGIIGLSFFLWLLYKTYKRIMKHEAGSKSISIFHNSKFIILTAVLILGFFDHYFLTLQQGQLLTTLILGLCWAWAKKPV